MTGRATVTTGRRRSPPANAVSQSQWRLRWCSPPPAARIPPNPPIRSPIPAPPQQLRQPPRPRLTRMPRRRSPAVRPIPRRRRFPRSLRRLCPRQPSRGRASSFTLTRRVCAPFRRRGFGRPCGSASRRATTGLCTRLASTSGPTNSRWRRGIVWRTSGTPTNWVSCRRRRPPQPRPYGVLPVDRVGSRALARVQPRLQRGAPVRRAGCGRLRSRAIHRRCGG